jgi:hypothetical protein
MREFDPGQGTYKVVNIKMVCWMRQKTVVPCTWVSMPGQAKDPIQEGLSDETKNRGPLYNVVPERLCQGNQKIPYRRACRMRLKTVVPCTWVSMPGQAKDPIQEAAVGWDPCTWVSMPGQAKDPTQVDSSL